VFSWDRVSGLVHFWNFTCRLTPGYDIDNFTSLRQIGSEGFRFEDMEHHDSAAGLNLYQIENQ